MKIIIEIPDNEFKNLMRDCLQEFKMETESTDINLYTVNKVAKRLNKSHRTIKKYIERGIIKTTKSGLITESAINDYLQNT